MAMENMSQGQFQPSLTCRHCGSAVNVRLGDMKDHKKICEHKTTVPTPTVTKPCQPLMEKNGREIGVLLMLLFGFLLLVMVAPMNSYIS